MIPASFWGYAQRLATPLTFGSIHGWETSLIYTPQLQQDRKKAIFIYADYTITCDDTMEPYWPGQLSSQHVISCPCEPDPYASVGTCCGYCFKMITDTNKVFTSINDPAVAIRALLSC